MIQCQENIHFLDSHRIVIDNESSNQPQTSLFKAVISTPFRSKSKMDSVESIAEKNREMYLISNYKNLKKIKVDLSIADFPKRTEYLQISRRLLSWIESKKGQLMISKLIQKRSSLEDIVPDNVGPSFEEWYDIFINVLIILIF
jgi:hypothetical protein